VVKSARHQSMALVAAEARIDSPEQNAPAQEETT
jgi:hypothetical protein